MIERRKPHAIWVRRESWEAPAFIEKQPKVEIEIVGDTAIISEPGRIRFFHGAERQWSTGGFASERERA